MAYLSSSVSAATRDASALSSTSLASRLRSRGLQRPTSFPTLSGTGSSSAGAAAPSIKTALTLQSVAPATVVKQPEPAAAAAPVAETGSTPVAKQAASPATAAAAPSCEAPTAESVFGANPWLSNPTGLTPEGNYYSYNPLYFASAATAAKVAEMFGGQVVETQELCSAAGSPFRQQQANRMVQLPDGRMINPGLVASFYTHGYPQSYIDRLLTNEKTGQAG